MPFPSAKPFKLAFALELALMSAGLIASVGPVVNISAIHKAAFACSGSCGGETECRLSGGSSCTCAARGCGVAGR
jgi:hypothetical protein